MRPRLTRDRPQRILTMLEADRTAPRLAHTAQATGTVRLRRPVARAEAGEARHHQGIQGHFIRPRGCRGLPISAFVNRDPAFDYSTPNPRFRDIA